MATFTSAKALADYQKKRASAFRREQSAVTSKEAERLVKRMNTRVQGLLSGTRTTKELMYLGHPYKRSRRRYSERERQARAVLKTARLLPINAQTGRLKKATHVYAVVTKFGSHQRIGLRLKSTADYALYQIDPEGKGTKTMRPRGFWKALMKSYQKYDQSQMRSARLKAARAAAKYLG